MDKPVMAGVAGPVRLNHDKENRNGSFFRLVAKEKTTRLSGETNDGEGIDGSEINIVI